MLVIPRTEGESVMIGDYLEIGIEEIIGDEARIWIRRLDDGSKTIVAHASNNEPQVIEVAINELCGASASAGVLNNMI